MAVRKPIQASGGALYGVLALLIDKILGDEVLVCRAQIRRSNKYMAGAFSKTIQ
jgi:hypothetical protein